MTKIVFKEVSGIMDILNAEGTILALRENEDLEGDMQKERLFIMGVCSTKNLKVYAKVNNKALEMFFQGRLSIKELFLLRIDEPYILEENLSEPSEIGQSQVFADEVFVEEVIEQLNGANQHYYTFSKNTIQHNEPYRDVLKIIDLFYKNGVNGHGIGVLRGTEWTKKYLKS